MLIIELLLVLVLKICDILLFSYKDDFNDILLTVFFIICYNDVSIYYFTIS